jgi:hypothetical protein
MARGARFAATVASLTSLLLGVGVAAAGADPVAGVTTVDLPSVPTLMYGGLCGTSVQAWASTSPAWPGRAILNVRAQPVVGIGHGPYPLAPVCTVLTTVAWHNDTTGAAGAYRVLVAAGLYGSIQYAQFQPTGPGHVEVTVSTDNANVPARGAFDVPGPLPPPPPGPLPPR